MKMIKRFILGELRNNCYLIKHNDKIILIDAPNNIEKVIKYLENKQLKLDYVFLTHTHFDHIKGLEVLKLYDNTIDIYVTKDEQSFLSKPEDNLSNLSNVLVCYQGNSKTYNELEMKGLIIKNISGHSKNSANLYFPEAQIVFTGDNLFRDSIGRSDFKYGNEELLINGIKNELLGLEQNVVVYPGHGFSTTIKNELNNKLLQQKGKNEGEIDSI